MSTIGQRIKELRTNKHMTQAELGKHLNVSNVSVSGYENDTREPDSAALNKLAELFDVSTDYILGRTDTPKEISKTNEQLSKNQKLVAYSIDPGISDEERDAIIKMVEAAKAFRKRI